MADTKTIKKSNSLQYDSETKTSTKGSAILGRLYGPIADIVQSTRNGRKYPEDLWEKVFADPVVIEQFECGGLFGEMNHPADREETDLTQVCVCMPEKPQKKDGKLWASFDILDTPNGRILKTLCDYGYKIGISSRGSGDTYEDLSGESVVDADTYQLFGWDIVLIPAVKSARLKYISESLNGKCSPIESSAEFKQALNESLQRASEEDKLVMLNTLNNLHLDYTISDDVYNTTVDSLNEDFSADDIGDSTLVEDLKQYIKENRNLNKQISSCQEKLSVCYTKESEYKKTIDMLNEEKNSLKNSISDNRKIVEKLNNQLKINDALITKFRNSQEKSIKCNTALTETISKKDEIIKSLNNKVSSLNESIEKLKENNCRSNQSLQESLNELTKNSAIKKSEFDQKLLKSNKLVERYKSIAQTAVDKYIQLQAKTLGVSSFDIKSKLSENYSFNDIDRVCESLKNFKLTMNSFPFDTSSKSVKVKISESPETKKTVSFNSLVDDSIDDTLIGIANLKQ